MELKIRHIGIAWVQRKLNDKKKWKKNLLFKSSVPVGGGTALFFIYEYLIKILLYFFLCILPCKVFHQLLPEEDRRTFLPCM